MITLSPSSPILRDKLFKKLIKKALALSLSFWFPFAAVFAGLLMRDFESAAHSCMRCRNGFSHSERDTHERESGLIIAGCTSAADSANEEREKKEKGFLTHHHHSLAHTHTTVICHTFFTLTNQTSAVKRITSRIMHHTLDDINTVITWERNSITDLTRLTSFNSRLFQDASTCPSIHPCSLL